MIRILWFVRLGEGGAKRSQAIAEVSQGGGRRWWRQEAGLRMF